MKTSMRYRIGAWLEARPWARWFVLREDPSTAEWVVASVVLRADIPHRLLRMRAVNRINGNRVMIERRPYERKRDGYVLAAMIGAVLGAVAHYGLTALIEALT